MRAPQLVRAAMVLVFVAVIVAVAVMWRDRTEDPSVDAPEPRDTGPGVVSMTTALRYTAEENGVLRYEVWAGRGVQYEDNRTAYEDGVEVRLYSVPEFEGGPQEVTVVTAERLEMIEREVPIEGDQYESVRLYENVRAVLPDGEEFHSDVLVYSDGELSTDEGVLMRAGGLVVESRDMTYDVDAGVARLRRVHPDTLRPQMRGPVKVWSEGSGGEVSSSDLQGSANTLVYERSGSRLRLLDAPRLLLPRAAQISGQEIDMVVAAQGGEVESIAANGRAHAQWWRDSSMAPDEPGESDQAAVQSDRMDAETIEVTLVNGEPQGLIASVVDPELPRPSLELADGTLRAEVLEVGFADDGSATMAARGEAYFFPQASANGLEYIGADELLLGSGQSDDLRADRNVEVRLRRAAGPITFSGPRARLAYRDGALAEAEWPVGLSYHDEGQGTDMSAGHGALDPDSGDWLLRSTAPGVAVDAARRPRLRGSEMDVVADEIRMTPEGEVDLAGAVEARLSGDSIRTVGALFGDAPELQAAADELRLGGASDLYFTGNARVFRPGSEQLLQADEIRLRPTINELQADGSVFVSLVDPPDPQHGRDEERAVVLTGRSLLAEDSPLRLTMAGEALLEIQGQGRTIGGNRLTVQLNEEGVWDALEVTSNVVMTDPAGEGKGARLEYSADTGVVFIYAPESGEAIFVPKQGIDIRDSLGLRLEWADDNLRVTALQNGTTQTLRGGGGGAQR